MKYLTCKNCGYVFPFSGDSKNACCGDCGYTNEYSMYLPKEDDSGQMFDDYDGPIAKISID